MQGTDTLAVEAKVLGKRLADKKLEALGNEVADGPGVVLEVAGGKALVGAVKERVEAALFANPGNLAPLVLCGINARRVVSTGVKKHDFTLGSVREGVHEAVKVERDRVSLEVRVLLDGETDALENLMVVGPSRVRHVDDALGVSGRVVTSRGEVREEEGAKVVCAGARNSLDRGNAALSNSRGICTQNDLGGASGQVRETSDREILMV